MYPAISPMSLALLMLLTPTYSVPFRHNTSAEGSHAHATKWLPANIHHASPLEVARAVCRPEVYLPSLASTQSDTRLQGPVCVQAIRLDNCCNRGDDAHRALNVQQQRLRPCLRLRFFEGVWYGQSVSHASLTNKLAQLAIPDSVYNWILDFSRPRSLHKVCRNCICIR